MKQQYRYRAKIINPLRKTIYDIKSLSFNVQACSLSELRKYVKEEVSEFQGILGYVEPGHGSKGKMRELHDDEDVTEMYVLHKRRSDVLLWLYGNVESSPEVNDATPSRKRPRVDNPTPTTSKRESLAKTINAVEAIVEELREKHGDKRFSVEQLNCWAHMINSGKWPSQDEPPDFPFFKKQEKQKINQQTKSAADATPQIVSASSPSSKRLNRRAQCIDQLSKWHMLFEGGGITQAQYEEFKESILQDMK